MNENNRKRREWVKTAMIVFLSVMLMLTFFSNTIMNYSLPEVAVQYVEPGSITAKIRGNGVVETGDPYNVMVKQTRKVMSVAVREGDAVQAGDVIAYLEDGDSEELKNAQAALEAAWDAYDLALLAADVDSQIINNAHSNISSSTYRQRIDAAQAEMEKARKEVDEWQKSYDAFAVQIAVTPDNSADVAAETKALKEAKAALEEAGFAVTEAENQLSALTDTASYLKNIYKNTVTDNNASGSSDDELENVPEIKAVMQEKLAAEAALNTARARKNDAQLAYDKAAAALENKKASGNNAETIQNLTLQQAQVKANLDAASRNLEQKQQALNELTGDINKTLSLETLYRAVTEAQELVNKEREKAEGAVITADIAGTILQVNAVSGKEVSAAEAVAVIQPEGQGYTMSFSVTNQQATRLSVGDKAELINSWYYNDMNIILKSIRPDPTNPGKQKLLTFDVTGDVLAGQSLNVSVGQKSANYEMIVPNSAIREDSNGKFVLVVQAKSSPLGNRYIATRADVEVLASDDTKSAISGALYTYDYVLTTSTKPVEAGKQVRLAEN